MKKNLLPALAAVAVVAVAALIFFSRQTYVVELSRANLQEHPDRGFPPKKGVLIFTVELTEPKVTPRDGSDTIHFSVNVGTNIRIEGLTPKGTAAIETKIRYVPEAGEFYMSDPDVALNLDVMKRETLEKMNEVANLLIREHAAEHPFYRLKESDLKQNVARAVLKDVKVENGVPKLHLALT